jgi:preprotein translocase subunit SecE
MTDRIKYIVAALIVGGALAAFYYYGHESLLLRVVGLIIAAGIAAAVFSQTTSGRNTLVYLGEARTEVRKVVWPSRKETTQGTLAVIAMVVVIAVILWIFDSILAWIVRTVVARGGV